MKGIIISNIDSESKKKNKFGFDLYSALGAGLAGFTVFFVILLAAKYVGTLFGSISSFNIQTEDILLSLIGFTLLFLIKLLENLTKQKKAS